jgi:multicomponent Na+:H+ antiporter subunit A
MISTAVISGFVLALIAPGLHRLIPRWSGAVLSLLPLSLLVFFLGYLPEIASDATLVESTPWVTQLGVSFSFYLDGLSLVFAVLITGIGTLIVFYSGGYLAGHPELGRFYMVLLGFMASMLGVVLSANAITVFVFWELTSLTSYFLIGFDHHRRAARQAALQALLVTGLGGLALLAGFLLLGAVSPSLEMYELFAEADTIRGHGLYPAILVLILIGAFTKSAQFPFHFWLPSAMEGPAPVSAYLHSATMVKAGVYLLMRLNPVLGGTELWQVSLIAVGAVTMVSGAWLALLQHDLKRLLAYTTVNGLGTLVFLTGFGTGYAARAAVVFLIGHALYKGSLFLSAGVIDHETGLRDIRHIRGLYRHLPLITVAVVLAGASMAGLPPMLGFIAKELIYETVLDTGRLWWAVTGAALTASALLLAAAAVMVIRPFFGAGERSTPTHGHGPSPDLLIGPAVPALAGLVFGLAPFLLDHALVGPAASAVAGRAVPVHLALWHGLNPMLVLSAATVALGCGLYLGYINRPEPLDRWRSIGRWGPDRGYWIGLEGLKSLAAWQTRILQGGFLYRYILIIVLSTLGLTAMTLVRYSNVPLGFTGTDLRFFELVICVLMILGAGVAAGAGSRLTAIVSMGVVGYGMALLFIDFGAPDLAMTQFIIETMTVILFVLVIYRLPEYQRVARPKQLAGNILVAGASGLLMTFLVMVALNVQEGSRLSSYFAESSLLLAHGRNVVNVIIVDFRALDTLGEIVVLSLAGIGVYTLLKLRPIAEPAADRRPLSQEAGVQSDRKNPGPGREGNPPSKGEVP